MRPSIEEGARFRTANGRHCLAGHRLNWRRYSVCSTEAVDLGDPEPLPGGERGSVYFIKLAHPSTEGARDCLNRELELLKRLCSCDAVAQMVPEGEGSWDGLPFVVKHLFDWRTLHEVLRVHGAERIPSDQIGAVLHDMAAAAAACYRNGHCVSDWATNNVHYGERVLLDLSGAVRLGDKVLYARPECQDHGKEATPGVDVRGVCMLALDVFAREALSDLLYERCTYPEMLRQLSSGPPARLKRDLWNVVLAGLSLGNAQEFASPVELQNALAPWKRGRRQGKPPGSGSDGDRSLWQERVHPPSTGGGLRRLLDGARRWWTGGSGPAQMGPRSLVAGDVAWVRR